MGMVVDVIQATANVTTVGARGFFWGGTKGDALPPFCRNLLPTMLEVRYCVTGVLQALLLFAVLVGRQYFRGKSAPNAHALLLTAILAHGLAYGRCGRPLSPLWKGALCSRGHFVFNPPLIFTSSRLPTTRGSPSL